MDHHHHAPVVVRRCDGRERPEEMKKRRSKARTAGRFCFLVMAVRPDGYQSRIGSCTAAAMEEPAVVVSGGGLHLGPLGYVSDRQSMTRVRWVTSRTGGGGSCQRLVVLDFIRQASTWSGSG
ncbi:hypothetical protein Hdeb2414_s0479g00901961 [Helianthus debilis subsp. tardiflorus]